MNILITGGNGQLGSSLKKTVSEERFENKNNDNFIFTDVDELDITDRKAVEDFVEKKEIDMIINCAAYTNVDRAEDDYDLAELLNATAPGYLADAMARREGRLIHISTDYVFGGGNYNTPITEDAAPNPTGVYGLTKLHGEERIAASGVSALILRTSWLYSEFGNNFMKTIDRLAGERDELKVVVDQCGTPTYAGDLAAAIIDIVSNRKYEGKEGIYHYSNEGVCSWYDFATAIAGERCRVMPCHSDEFPSKVVRPSYSVMDKTKFKRAFGISIPHWHTQLKELKNS